MPHPFLVSLLVLSVLSPTFAREGNSRFHSAKCLALALDCNEYLETQSGSCHRETSPHKQSTECYDLACAWCRVEGKTHIFPCTAEVLVRACKIRKGTGGPKPSAMPSPSPKRRRREMKKSPMPSLKGPRKGIEVDIPDISPEEEFNVAMPETTSKPMKDGEGPKPMKGGNGVPKIPMESPEEEIDAVVPERTPRPVKGGKGPKPMKGGKGAPMENPQDDEDEEEEKESDKPGQGWGKKNPMEGGGESDNGQGDGDSSGGGDDDGSGDGDGGNSNGWKGEGEWGGHY